MKARSRGCAPLLVPHLTAMLGYAVTGRMRSTASPVRGRSYHENMNCWRYVASIPKPRVMVVEDVDEIPGAGALLGELHAVIGVALDCVGYVSNGSLRDVPAVQALGFHLFAGGVAVSHMYAHISEYGKPIDIGGMKIRPGSLIHGDRHGVHCIPLSIASEIPNMAAPILREESELKQFCRSPRFSLGASEKNLQKLPGNGFELPLTGSASQPSSMSSANLGRRSWSWVALCLAAGMAGLSSCGGQNAGAKEPGPGGRVREVGVVQVARRNLHNSLSVSSELVPFQQIDVYAKEAGFVKELNVDYGVHVKAGQVMAVLEIPELERQLDEDRAAIQDAAGQVSRNQNEVERAQAQYNVAHLQYTRLAAVAKSRPGLVAQQEVDDWQAKDLATEAQVDAARSALESAKSQLDRAQARLRRTEAIFDYSKITAPFNGVVTQRYANFGTLMQSGTNSSTQALPLVQLSQDDLYRLVIPVAESYVRYIRVGDPVEVKVPSLNKSFSGKVARFSVQVAYDTRTMHTEVDVPDPQRVLTPGMYAEATLTIVRKDHALVVPQEAINLEGGERSVWVVGPSKRLEKRAVMVGVETPDYVEILSGLREGEWVVAGDRGSLSVGQPVRPKEISLIRVP